MLRNKEVKTGNRFFTTKNAKRKHDLFSCVERVCPPRNQEPTWVEGRVGRRRQEEGAGGQRGQREEAGSSVQGLPERFRSVLREQESSAPKYTRVSKEGHTNLPVN